MAHVEVPQQEALLRLVELAGEDVVEAEVRAFGEGLAQGRGEVLQRDARRVRPRAERAEAHDAARPLEEARDPLGELGPGGEELPRHVPRHRCQGPRRVLPACAQIAQPLLERLALGPAQAASLLGRVHLAIRRAELARLLQRRECGAGEDLADHLRRLQCPHDALHRPGAVPIEKRGSGSDERTRPAKSCRQDDALGHELPPAFVVEDVDGPTKARQGLATLGVAHLREGLRALPVDPVEVLRGANCLGDLEDSLRGGALQHAEQLLVRGSLLYLALLLGVVPPRCVDLRLLKEVPPLGVDNRHLIAREPRPDHDLPRLIDAPLLAQALLLRFVDVFGDLRDHARHPLRICLCTMLQRDDGAVLVAEANEAPAVRLEHELAGLDLLLLQGLQADALGVLPRRAGLRLLALLHDGHLPRTTPRLCDDPPLRRRLLRIRGVGAPLWGGRLGDLRRLGHLRRLGLRPLLRRALRQHPLL
mmetsp:Transcript_112486/g.314318  ORF Transcript_112486/g.314318 Transcript_112486/m.314318 type:complete len:477 (+) Transcript_112486:1279-2709(+)